MVTMTCADSPGAARTTANAASARTGRPLRAGPAAGVADTHRKLQVAAVGQPASTLHGLVVPGGVAEAMAERVRRSKACCVVAAVADQQTLGVIQHTVSAGLGVQDWHRG